MKSLLARENRVLLISLLAVLTALVVSAVIIIVAASGGFSLTPASPAESDSVTVGGEDWEDPDNQNWTPPIK